MHPDYNFTADENSDRVRNDLALLELRWPIRNGIIEPFDVGETPRKGDRVGVVSYARNRSEAPSLQEVCEVLAQQQGVLVTSCSVDFGSSGAPIFDFGEDEMSIVSVISAKAETDGTEVSLGTPLAHHLDVLRSELNAGKGYANPHGLIGARVLASGERNETGAKFIRP